MKNLIDVSVIITVCGRYDEIGKLHREYKKALEQYKGKFEFIYVLDGDYPVVFDSLMGLKNSGENISIIKFAKWFGEATAITAGCEHSSGEIILTLPAYSQICAEALPDFITRLDKSDMIVARRWPRIDSLFNRVQSKIFNFMQILLTGYKFHDLGCGVRAFKRHVLNDINIYGDQHRFLPVLVSQQGFNVKEINVAQSSSDKSLRVYSLGVYVRRFLDILTVFFLTKFTKKPLRFFGLIGFSVFVVGSIFLLYVVVERLFFDQPLADRPALLLSSLFVVLGVQIFILGLIGELVIFVNRSGTKDYSIEEIID